jgi:hypothetical protein
MSELGDAGRQGGFNGRQFEQDVVSRLLRHGYVQLRALPAPPTVPFFLHPWRSPYRTPSGQYTPDFYLWHPDKYPEGCVLECKYQETKGTADEKLRHVMHCLWSTGLPSILLVIGKGFRPTWQEECKKYETARFIVITSFDEWIQRLNRGLV